MAEPLLDRAKAAIDALDSPQHCLEASAWLVAFERTPDAWTVAQQLMQEHPSTNKRFHGANMFYHKIRGDFLQLGDQAPYLKQTLIDHLVALAAEPQVDIPVYRRVCLSIAALALQMNQAGVVGDILGKLNSVVTSAPRLLLELLTVLPEECYNRHIIVAPKTRHQFSDQLQRSAAEVFQFLQSLAASCSAGPPSAVSLDTQRQILICLDRWIDNAEIPLNAVLLPSGIFAFALDALSQKPLLEEATGVMIVVMRRHPYSPHAKDTSLVSRLLPRIMGVRALWTEEMAAHGGPSADVCRSVSRLFTETMESYIELYLSNADYGQHLILAQLLDCARFKEDFDVTRIPLRAFYELATSLKELRHEMTNAEYEPLRTSLAPYFLELLSIATQQLVLEDGVLKGEDKLDSDEQGARDEWRESILDACDIVGPVACVERVCAALQTELSKANNAPGAGAGGGGAVSWAVVEACLFTIQIVGAQLPANENTFIPQILQLCGSCPPIPGLSATIIQLSGSVSHWVSTNRQFLPGVFEKLMGALALPALSMPASVALLRLCKHCGVRGSKTEERLPLERLFHSLLQLRTGGGLCLEADCTVLEGLTFVISDLPPVEAASALTTVLQPIAESLSALLLKAAPLALVVADVERATVLLRYTSLRRDTHSDTHPVTEVFLLLWPLLIQTMNTYNSDSCAEKICRLYKYVIKSSGRYFLPHLNKMAEHIVHMFSQRPIASFLYVAAVFFGEFGALAAPFGGSDSPVGVGGGSPVGSRSREAALSPTEAEMTQQCLSSVYVYMTKMFFERYRTVEDFGQNPDVVEEYFYLAARVVQFFPEVLLNGDAEASQRAQMLVQAGILGLRIQHRETVKGILTMFAEIINILLAKQRDNMSEREKTVRTVASSMVWACASVLVSTLLTMVSDFAYV
jgi:hypothetical protein